MINENLVDKILLYGKGRGFSIKHTIKFQSNDFEFEIVESPYKLIYDENNKFIRSGTIFAFASIAAAGLMACVLLPVYFLNFL